MRMGVRECAIGESVLEGGRWLWEECGVSVGALEVEFVVVGGLGGLVSSFLQAGYHFIRQWKK
jgi:hypothetical protein